MICKCHTKGMCNSRSSANKEFKSALQYCWFSSKFNNTNSKHHSIPLAPSPFQLLPQEHVCLQLMRSGLLQILTQTQFPTLHEPCSQYPTRDSQLCCKLLPVSKIINCCVLQPFCDKQWPQTTCRISLNCWSWFKFFSNKIQSNGGYNRFLALSDHHWLLILAKKG